MNTLILRCPHCGKPIDAAPLGELFETSGVFDPVDVFEHYCPLCGTIARLTVHPAGEWAKAEIIQPPVHNVRWLASIG